jgi:hypothetical protein
MGKGFVGQPIVLDMREYSSPEFWCHQDQGKLRRSPQGGVLNLGYQVHDTVTEKTLRTCQGRD